MATEYQVRFKEAESRLAVLSTQLEGEKATSLALRSKLSSNSRRYKSALFELEESRDKWMHKFNTCTQALLASYAASDQLKEKKEVQQATHAKEEEWSAKIATLQGIIANKDSIIDAKAKHVVDLAKFNSDASSTIASLQREIRTHILIRPLLFFFLLGFNCVVIVFNLV